jgi:predicted dienelactone hydrolase
MRNFETVLLGLLVIAMGARLLRGTWVGGRLLGGGIALALVGHLLVEGVRLPMAAGYLVALVSLAGLLRDPRPVPARSRLRAAAGWLGGLVAVALAVLPPWIFPVFELPTPTGPHSVGGTVFSLVDESRREIFGPDSGTARSVVVRAWYPSAVGSAGPTMPYADPREVASPILPLIPVPLARQYRYVKTHTIHDAPLGNDGGPFPVLIFSHGYTGYTAQNTPQMEDLASRGYAVFSIGHANDASAIIHPDGRVVRLDPGLVAMMKGMVGNQDSVIKVTQGKVEAMAKATTPDERKAAFLAFTETNPPRIEQSVPVWAADTRFLIDQLARPDGPAGQSRFAGKLDTTRIGVFGMSFGGSNAGMVCWTDPRCKAGINIDGQQFGGLIHDSLTTPFMVIGSEAAFPVHLPIYDRLTGPAYLLKLVGTQHIGLTDLPYLAPFLFRKLGITGTMRVERSEQLMTDYVGAFFDTYLKGQPSPLLAEGSTAPPDVLFQAKNR